jgi:WD40 repeat protein
MSETFDPYHVWLGITSEEQPPDHYRLLGVSRFEGNPDVIQSASDQRMAHLRTFQTGKHSQLSQRLLNEVAAARLCLLNPGKKALYDEQLRAKVVQKPSAFQGPQEPALLDPGIAGLLEQVQTAPVGPSTRARAAQGGTRRNAGIAVASIAAVSLLALVVWGLLSGEQPAKQTSAVAPPAPRDTPPPRPREGYEVDRRAVAVPVKTPPAPLKSWPEPPKKTAADAEGPAAKTSQPEVPPAKEPPAAEESKPQTMAPQEPSAPEKSKPERLPLPAEARQREIIKQVGEIYNFSGAEKPAQKRELAERLAKLAGQAKDPDERFVLLRKAMELAGEGGDVESMLQTVDAIGAEFDIDPLGVKQKVLASFAASAMDSARTASLVDGALSVVDQAMEAGRYPVASAVLEATHNACQRAAGAKFRKRVSDRRIEVQRVCEAWKGVEEALEKLKSNPDDPEANSKAGRWYCLYRGDWDKGLPYLAKSSDDHLHEAARREIEKAPVEAADQVKLGDAWWDLAKGEQRRAKEHLLRHAASWYEKAKPNITSVVIQEKLAQRLAEANPSDEVETPMKAKPPAAKPVAAKPPAGKRLPRRKPIKHFDAAGAELIATLPGGESSVQTFLFGPDSSILVYARHKEVIFWDVARRQARATLPSHIRDVVRGLALSTDGSLLAAASLDGTVTVWNPVTMQLRGTVLEREQAFRVAFSPDGSLLACGTLDKTVKVVDSRTGGLRKTLEGHAGWVWSLAFSPDGLTLATAGSDRVAKVWDVATWRLSRELEGPSSIKAVAFSPDGSVLAARHDSAVLLWDARKGTVQRTIEIGGTEDASLAFHPDGSLLASGCNDKTVKLWDVASGELRRSLPCEDLARCLAFSPDGSMLANGGKALKLWGPRMPEKPIRKVP